MRLRSILILPCFFLLACGIKGPPLPPLKEETIQGQKNWDAVEKTSQPEDPLPKEKKPSVKKKNKTRGN